MKKSILWMFAAIMLVCGLAITTSCADKEDGESNSEWKLRNSISGTGWSTYSVKLDDGTWNSEKKPLLFDIKFSASNKNFKCDKVYTNEEGDADETTREIYKYSDETAYTIKKNVIEGTVGADKTPYFKMEVYGEVSSELHCKITFYKDNKTFEIKMWRAVV